MTEQQREPLVEVLSELRETIRTAPDRRQFEVSFDALGREWDDEWDGWAFDVG